MISALFQASARLSKLLILNIFWWSLSNKYFYFHIFTLFLLFSVTILSYTLILPILQLSHIEYLIQTYNILVLILKSKLTKNLVSLMVFISSS